MTLNRVRRLAIACGVVVFGAANFSIVPPLTAQPLEVESSTSIVQRAQTVDLRVNPAPLVGRDKIFATIGGLDAIVESVEEDRVRVKVPLVDKGLRDVRLIILGQDATQPPQTGTAQITVTSPAPGYRSIARVIVFSFLALTLFVLYHATPKTNADRWNRVLFLIYDDGTDSYSVKRLQAVLWFMAVLPIVLFAFVLTRFEAGVGAWIELPTNVLYLLGTSAATAVVAEGLERMRKPAVKSATKRASWQDLFQENEQFSFARFQIICWTVVTCSFFVSTYWSRADVAPTVIPDIPESFWLLMGLSSATYVGAKLTDGQRGAPQIQSAVLTPARDELIIRARGIALRFDMMPEGWFTVTGLDTKGRSQTFALATNGMLTQQIDAELYRITIPVKANMLQDASGGSHVMKFASGIRVHLTNPDGQISADVTITC